MAKEKEHDEKKPKRKHLHQVRTEATHDGKFIHHETYKKHKDDTETEPERVNAAVSNSPEEAGQHVEDMMAQNQQGGGDEGGGGEPEPGAGAPAGGAPGE